MSFAMEHKGLPYSVVQAASAPGWKWIVHLNDRRTKIGTAPSREMAIRLAELAIEDALKTGSMHSDRQH
jgi:hypothetical protein